MHENMFVKFIAATTVLSFLVMMSATILDWFIHVL